MTKLGTTTTLVRDVGVLGDDDLVADLAHVAHVEVASVRALNVVAHRVRLAARFSAHAARVVRSNVGLDVLLQLCHRI